MKNIADAVIKELKDKNASMDVIKMCIRVAISASGIEITEKEFGEIFDTVILGCPFDPTSSVMTLDTKAI